MLGFRQGTYLHGHANTLSIILERRTNEIWDLHFRDSKDQSIEHKDSEKATYVVWGREQRRHDFSVPPLPFDDNSMRVFRCIISVGKGCHTFYNVPVCEGYYFPMLLVSGTYRSARPILIVLTKTPEASEAMFENYDPINVLVRHAIQRLTEISCR